MRHTWGMDEDERLARLERLVLYLAQELGRVNHACDLLIAGQLQSPYPGAGEDGQWWPPEASLHAQKRLERMLDMLREEGLEDAFSQMRDRTL